MLEKFVKQTKFESTKDFIDNYHISVPENFNFAYDVVDVKLKRFLTEQLLSCFQ